MSVVVTLPWPPSALSPNGSHGHWAPRARAKKAYRHACYVAVLEQDALPPEGDRFDVLLSFCPPTRRKLDRDNLVARMKSGLDGLAEAWGVDDSQFVRVAAELGDQEAGGRVVVRVEPHEAAT